MTRRQSGLGLSLAVAGGCLALLLLLIGLATRSGASDDPAVGLPVVVGGLVVVATLLALGWRAVTRRHSDL